MAKQDILGQLAKKPLPVKIGIIVGILVVAGFVYWQFMYSSLSEEYNTAVAQFKKLDGNNKRLRDEAKECEDLAREKEKLDAENAIQLRMLPAESELPAFLKTLQNQAGTSGIKIKNYQQMAEVPIESYMKVPYKLEASGSFYQINKYFWLLWKGSETGRIITIENLQLFEAVPTSEGLSLTASFVVSTFRKQDAPPAAAPPPEDKSKKTDKAKADDKKADDKAKSGDKAKDAASAAEH